MRLVCLSQTQIRPSKPNTGCRGLLPHPAPHSQGPEHFQQAVPSQGCRPGGPLKGGSTEEAEEKEMRLFSSFPSKTSRGRGPICGLTFALFMVLTKGILKMWLPLCFPLGLHLWLTTEARGLKLGHAASRAPPEGCCSQSRGQGRWNAGDAQEK